MKTILIAGGSGLVGSRLTQRLLDQGHRVRWLSRTARKGKVTSYKWDTSTGYIDANAFDDVEVIINLAGAGIADSRWTASRKKLLVESRTKTAALLDQHIQKLNPALHQYINASAIGYYGDQGDALQDETSSAGDGFLSSCCEAWEEAAHKITGSFPKAIIRIGVVLSTQGGALEKMLLPLKLKTNTYFGNGSQYMSWIHIDDLCRIFEHLIANPQDGIFNAVASHPQTNKDLVQAVAKGMDTSALLVPAPAFALRLAMGEMADVVLESTRVSNQKVKGLGFEFEFEDVAVAVKDLNKRKI